MTVDEYKEEVERNRPRMLSVARSYLKASEEAEDVVQDVLLKLWQLLDKLRIPMGPLALIFPITWRRASQHVMNAMKR